MASSYSTDLKLELMVTGEKAGQWGDITNTNLVILQQAIAGYAAVSIAGGAGNTDLTFTNAATSDGKNAVLELTGTITGKATSDTLGATLILLGGPSLDLYHPENKTYLKRALDQL